MELSMKMLVPPVVLDDKNGRKESSMNLPDTNERRKVDCYFASNERSKHGLGDNWPSPESVLARLYEELPEAGHPISQNIELPYYLYGITYKLSDRPEWTPSWVMSTRRCTELCIDGINTDIEFRDGKLFVVNRRNGLEYELADSFRSKILC